MSSVLEVRWGKLFDGTFVPYVERLFMNNPFDYPGLRIIVVFFNEPYGDFHLREIAKLADVS